MTTSSSHVPSDAGADALRPEATVPIAQSPAQLVRRRLRHDRVAMASAIALAAIIALALAAGPLTHLLGVNPFDFNPDLISDDGGLPVGPLGGAGWPHLLGVEPLTGRDIFARLLYGARASLLIAALATLATLVLGTALGAVSGYARGAVDSLLGRFMDLVLAFPLLLVVIALAPVLDQRLAALGVPEGNPTRIVGIIVVLSAFGWPYLARIVRGQVLSLRERDYVTAARAMGASTTRILVREVLPGVTSVILVYATLLMPSYIAAEAALAYLGISVQPPTPTWGAMLDDSVTYFTVDPFYFFAPMLALVTTVLAFNLLGDSLRDALAGDSHS